MRPKTKTWYILSLLLLVAGVWMWHVGNRVALERMAERSGAVPITGKTAMPVSGHPGVSNSTVNGVTPTNSAGKSPKPFSSYVLRNTSESPLQLARNEHGLVLKTALIDTSRRVALDIPAQLRSQGSPGSYIVQWNRPLDKAFNAVLEQAGAEFVGYLPVDAALVKASASAAQAMASEPGVQAVLPYEPYYKLSPSLLPLAVEGEPLLNNELRVTAFPGEGDAAWAALKAMGANLMGEDQTPFGPALIVTVPPDKLVAVAQMPQTQVIEPFTQRRMLDDLGRVRLGVSANTTITSNYLNLYGSNIYVALPDTGVDSTHPDFKTNRLFSDTPNALVDTNGHGTHVAGIIAGNGSVSTNLTNAIPGSVTGANFRGMASSAKLYAMQVDMVTGPVISDSYLQSNASYYLTSVAKTNGTIITNGFLDNNSWGYQRTGYDISAASYDEAVRDSQPGVAGEHAMAYVFAAGDNGDGTTNGDGGVADSITSPGTAKNVITVAAMDSPRNITNTVNFSSEGITNDDIFYGDTDNSNLVASFSSRGNVDIGTEGNAGRFKPDVVAPGVFIVSARSTNYVDPTNQQVLYLLTAPSQNVPPGQANIYAVTIPANATNLAIQVLPNAFSPVPFPNNLQVFFGTNLPPTTLVTATNYAGLPVVEYPMPTNSYIAIYNPSNSPQPVAYDLNAFVLETNDLGTYYTTLSNLNSALKPYYRYESGSSMASAAVTGMLALMQEFLETRMGVTPSPALLKGLLINGSRPLGDQYDFNVQPGGPNFEGWGLPYLANSIPGSLTNTGKASLQFYDQSPTNALQTGQWHNYSVNVTDSNAVTYPLRVTLVWTDPPGNPAAGLALVNDLDLVVTDSAGDIYIGNDFQYGDIFTEISPSTNLYPSDVANNVENVYIDTSFYNLSPPYTVSVRAHRVNVNAATTQTNAIGQDYSLVISSDYQTPTEPLAVTDLGVTNPVPVPLVTPVTDAVPLLNQRVGANEPNLYNYATGATNGNALQWHFFAFTNNVTLTNGAYTNVIFATFLPPTLTFPSTSPPNLSQPAANNADIDLYVSTNPALTNLDPNAIFNSYKSLNPGGTELVVIPQTNQQPVVYYAGVKSETQQGADFAFFAIVATNLNSLNSDGSTTAYGIPLPSVIPDSTVGGQGANVLAIVTSPMSIRKVQVGLGISHANPADLYGTLYYQGQQAVLNHYDGAPGGFTNIYDDLPENPNTPTVPSDGPGHLTSFVGLSGSGLWRLNETDNALTQNGAVTALGLTVWPQPPFQNGLPFYVTIPPNGWYYGYVDVPDDATNLNIALIYNTGSAGIYITNQDSVDTSDYGTNIAFPLTFPQPSLNLSSTILPPLGPPLSGGRWYYGITNTGGTTLSNMVVMITIQESGISNLTLTVGNTNMTPLQTDAHTQSEICISNGILANNQQLASLAVGIRLNDTNLDDLVIRLISPQGTSSILFEDRGGLAATNLGVTTNGIYYYTTFTENTNQATPDPATQLVKFAAPPFGQQITNVNLVDTSFETVSAGDYGQTNSFITNSLGANLEGWTLLTNDVSVVANENLYLANTGTNFLALTSGLISNSVPTIIGDSYALSIAYRGPGLLDWWPFEGNFKDLVGSNNGALTSGEVTNATGQVGLGVQFSGTNVIANGTTINFGTNTGNFGTNDFTIDYWMNTHSTNKEEAFLEKRASCANENFWTIRIGSVTPLLPPGTINMEIDGAPSTTNIVRLSSIGTFNDAIWHHVAWVRRSTTLLLYVDGVLNNTVIAGELANVSSTAPLTMGTSVCDGAGGDGTGPYNGAADELDLWNRALTDVEIADLYTSGSNHLGKYTTASIYPNAELQINGIPTATLIVTNTSGPWQTNVSYFTATTTNATFTLQGNPFGLLFDDIILVSPTNHNYVMPEESLAAYTGENPYGCWTIDIQDTRADSSQTTNGVLLGWNLQMTVSSSNVDLVYLTNHVPYTNGVVPPFDFAYFAFDVPTNAMFATNSMTNGSSPLNLLFNQTMIPTGSQPGDYTLIGNSENGAAALSITGSPPTLEPGARYYLAVQNTNAVAATFTVQIDTDTLTNFTAIPLTNGVVRTQTTVPNPIYYSFVIPTNAVLASFEIINPPTEIDLYARHELPLPSSTFYDYATAFNYGNDASIVITSNTTPVPLAPGTWYLAAYLLSGPNVTYSIVARYVTNGGITIIPLTNYITTNLLYSTNGTAAPGPAITNFYSFTVTNAVPAVQFELGGATETALNLIVNLNNLPTPQQMIDEGFNAFTPQEVTIVTNDVTPSLIGTWYLGIQNNTAVTTNFVITATTNVNAIYTAPAVVFLPGAAVLNPTNGFTFTWTAVANAQYEIDISTNLVTWTNLATVTTTNTAGSFTDPTAAGDHTARFYRLDRTQ